MNNQLRIILGQYPAKVYFMTASIMVSLIIILIYWISQYMGHDKPFPYSTISRVANHYPQYVFFRIGTISGSVLLVLGWMTNYMYIESVCMERIINIHKFKIVVNASMILGIAGAICLMFSTALIDTGKMDGDFHVICATLFFLLTLFAQLLNTVVFGILCFKFNAVNKIITYVKIVVAGLIVIQMYLELTKKTFFFNTQYMLGQIEGKSAFLEWSLTYTILFGLFLSALDVKNFRFVYGGSQFSSNNQTVVIHNN